jgi:hypothetical protein
MTFTGWIAAFFLIAISILARAEDFVPSSTYLKATPLTNRPEPSPWSAALRYGYSSDYADERQPRAYEHLLASELEYKIDPKWSATIDGQIPKGREQSFAEVLNPSTSLEVAYGDDFYERRHHFSIGVHGEPLWTEDSRLEGHQALLGVGGRIQLNFFNKRYSMTHDLDATSVVNTYHYGSDLNANPDYFWTYKVKNDFRFARTWKASYSFGAKVTRYLDNFVGYSYNNTFGLSKTWRNFAAALTYDNGGFTDDGYVRLWYIDEYRRVLKVMVSYAF